ncbi:hypothetical protein ANCDUO_05538 [Ancylostoma duodenale]|uniref:Uncharacterized protein n=1 Tax=Ancylostoma duodenale TaxID=51022 RepID=A0A0C2GYF3_9BILA|nr:hypothetical protein ANCDUO_05538 [Ancylostoma duodenale]
MGGTEAGRSGVLADGWRRCSAKRVGTSDNDEFYTTDLLAKAVSLTFVKIPDWSQCETFQEFIHRLYVSSEHLSEKLDGKKIHIKSTDRKLEMVAWQLLQFFFFCGILEQIRASTEKLGLRWEGNQSVDSACLRVRMGGTEAGRSGVLADGWRRCSAKRVGTSDNDEFYTTDLLAKAVSLTFVKIPDWPHCETFQEFIHRLYVSSEHLGEKLDGKKIHIKSTDRKLEMDGL